MDGNAPQGALIADSAGNLYGTTTAGGSGTNCTEGSTFGCGTVYRIAPGGAETVLYAFKGGCDGSAPFSSMVRDGSGNLYGTTSYGGSCGGGDGTGTVFKLAPDGTESVLYAFTGGSDGYSPLGNLIIDSTGNLYGTTVAGGKVSGCSGSGCGVVFKVAPDNSESVIYTFQGGSDGGAPGAGLLADGNGNLYGTASTGGNLAGCDGIGCGVVFKVTPDGGETVLYTFQGGTDGGQPESTLIMDASGNLYGTTQNGGSVQSCRAPFGCGVVFKLSPDGTETVLHGFNGGSDGELPEAGVIMDNSGILYGTTYFGGGTGCRQTGHLGCGTIFKITSNGTEKILSALDSKRGTYPRASLLLQGGFLYGTASQGGGHKDGVVFQRKK